MHKTSWRFGVPLLLVAGALAGCSKSNSNGLMGPGGGSTSGTALDQARVTSVMSQTPTLVEDGVAESSDQFDVGSGAMMGPSIDAAIQPLFFFRRITSVDRHFEFAFSDTDSTGRPTTAMVTILKTLKGTFNILERSPSDTTPPSLGDTSLHVVHKPLEDHWVRHLMLKRVMVRGLEGDDADEDDHGMAWRVVATSGVQVTSAGATTGISSLRIQSGTVDTTITDPLALFRLRRFLKLTSGAMVTLTATTGRNDDVVVLSYPNFRKRFTNNGDNTYTVQVRAGWLEGVRHFGVNALSHGTLFDDSAAYDSQAWILPYVVQPTEMAEFLP